MPSPGTGESGARARLAFRILVQSAFESLATPCGKVHRVQQIGLIPIALTPFYICLLLFICLSCASIDRVILVHARLMQRAFAA